MKNLKKETIELIKRDFDLEKVAGESMQEEALLRLLEDQVAYYIQYRMEFLLSSMYRLDISEESVRQALMPTNEVPANIALAKLILDRQKKRIQTKNKFKQSKIEDLEEGLEF